MSFLYFNAMCTISARCSIEAQAFGGNYAGVTKYGFFKLNGAAVWQASWQGEYHVNRGANMFTIDTAACTVLDSQRFDTHGDPAATSQLNDYLQGLSDGTVLVGISCDEANYQLSTATKSTLSGLGADVSDVGMRGAWAFVAEIGDPSKTVFDKELNESSALERDPVVTASFAGASCDLLLKQIS